MSETRQASNNGPGGSQTSVSAEHWQGFGQEVLRVHHRRGNGYQCMCGHLMEYCPVIAAAVEYGLPTDDPRGLTAAQLAHRLEQQPGLRRDAGAPPPADHRVGRSAW